MDEQKELVVPEPTVGFGSMEVSPKAVIETATAIATELAKVIKKQNLFSIIQGKEFVRVEGWTTLGAMLGVTPRELENVADENGVYTAIVELVRNSDGSIIGRASAECGSPDELDKNGKPTWANRAAYARRSMAATRATGKAYRLAFSWIMALAGYEVTPAEEMDYVDVKSKDTKETDFDRHLRTYQSYAKNASKMSEKETQDILEHCNNNPVEALQELKDHHTPTA